MASDTAYRVETLYDLESRNGSHALEQRYDARRREGYEDAAVTPPVESIQDSTTLRVFAFVFFLPDFIGPDPHRNGRYTDTNNKLEPVNHCAHVERWTPAKMYQAVGAVFNGLKDHSPHLRLILPAAAALVWTIKRLTGQDEPENLAEEGASEAEILGSIVTLTLAPPRYERTRFGFGNNTLLRLVMCSNAAVSPPPSL